MAKKKNLKELREQQKQEKIQKYKNIEEAKKIEAEEKKKEAEERKKEAEEKKKEEIKNKEIKSIEKANPKMGKVKKSQAKAAGLKSTFIVSDNKLLMTSFGKGNDAVPDKYIVGKEIKNASLETVLDVKNNDVDFSVSGRLIKDAHTDNPLNSNKKPGMDQIKLKDKLEMIYFGQTFEDNIHIQLIYNILDIEKILGVHVNNIVYEIGNIFRTEENKFDDNDLIGYLSERKSYEKFKESDLYDLFCKLINQKQMAYFGSEFVPVDRSGKQLEGKDKEKFIERCYYLFTLIGVARQATSHGDIENRSKLYRIDDYYKLDNAKNELDKLYNKKIEELNNNFLEHSGKDLQIVFNMNQINDENDKISITKDFYSFLILKDYKNMGFSIKRVRENIPDKDLLKDKKYDSVRQKLNRLLDFVIWQDYKNNAIRVEKLVEKLRASEKESEKEFIYREEAKRFWSENADSIKRHLLPQLDGNYIKSLEMKTINNEWISNVKVSQDACGFSKLIYLLTLFLDGKEINDLITQLISKFENIDSFVNILKNEQLVSEFTKYYKIFENSKKVSEELRLIISFARMSKESLNAKKTLYMEAGRLLGYSDEENEPLENYVDKMLSPNNNDKGFRNFIANNVIESNRFKYLVRYGNPEKLRKLADNIKVVEFVLEDIPDDQIRAYYNSCNEGENIEYNDSMRTNLANIITKLSFVEFSDIKSGKNANTRENEIKEKKKCIIRLYLTVLYLLVKNLVYINSRYYLAFQCLERDALIFNSKKYRFDKDADWREFAKDYVESELFTNYRAKKYIHQNFNNSDEWAIKRGYRNNIDHLNAVRNASYYINDISSFDSYFELYHYIIQRNIIAQYEHDCEKKSDDGKYLIDSLNRFNPKTKTYFEMVLKYKSYSKDFVKALNVPFAYNLARYKNLSINELFDRNNYLPSKFQIEPLEE